MCFFVAFIDFYFLKSFFLVCVLAKNDAKKPIFASHKRGVIVCYFGYVIFSIYFKIVWKRNHTQKKLFL